MQGRGTMLIEARKLSRYLGVLLQADARLSRPTGGSVGMSGCKTHYKVVLGAGANAKSMTNNLPILSVLAGAYILFFPVKVECYFIVR